MLSTSKYRRLVDKAKLLGFEVRLIYVLLDTPERNIERVRLRVRKGGHAVPEEKILERHARSLAQLPWVLKEADQAWLFDNSGASPRLVGEKQRGSSGSMKMPCLKSWRRSEKSSPQSEISY